MKRSYRKRDKKKKEQEMSVGQILMQPGTPTVYIPTVFGAMKVFYTVDGRGHHFNHHYTRNSVARYRCSKHESDECLATVVVKEKLTYPGISEHSHSCFIE